MSENIKTPFEQARHNINMFAENADLLFALQELKKVLDEAEKLSEEEQEGVQRIVDAAIKNLSNVISDRGDKWN